MEFSVIKKHDQFLMNNYLGNIVENDFNLANFHVSLNSPKYINVSSIF